MDAEDVHAILDRADELLEAGQPAESLRCLKALEDSLLDADERIERTSLEARALLELGRSDEAIDMLELLIDEYPRSARLHGTLGLVLSHDGDLGEARDALERAVMLDACDEVALANLGLVYERLRQYDHALILYEQAIEMGAELDWLLQRKAAVQTELGELAAARSTLKRYLSLMPDDAEQWLTLAILCSDEFDFEQAFCCYRAAEQITPDSVELRLNWGVTAVRAHQVELAQRQLVYLARLEPESSRPLLLKALVEEEQGEPEAAAQTFVDALARVSHEDYAELTCAFEMSMDFFARQKTLDACERLLDQAYAANACTVELCEAYREATGPLVERANWYSLILEGDYRPGLEEVTDPGDAVNQPHTRFLRNYQVIARDHDEAIALVTRFAERMGESNVLVREFAGDETVADGHVGMYEVERESLVLADVGVR